MLRAAVIGLGVGERYIDGYNKHPHCKLVSLCDIDEKVCERMRKKYPELSITNSPDSILEDPNIDVVSIATYDVDHYKQVIKALKFGKHVFVEKPLCLFENEAIEIKKLLKERPRLRLTSNLVLRENPRFKLIKKLISERYFGELYFLEGDYNYGRFYKLTEGWRGKIDFYSVVCGGAIHMIDLLIWFADVNITEVMAYGNAICSIGTQFKFDDCVVCLLKFENYAIGKVSANFGCVFPHYHLVNVYGREATFTNQFNKSFIFSSREPVVNFKEVNESYSDMDKSVLIPDFISSILNNTKSIVPEEDVFKTLSVCFAIQKSLKEKAPVKVNYI